LSGLGWQAAERRLGLWPPPTPTGGWPSAASGVIQMSDSQPVPRPAQAHNIDYSNAVTLFTGAVFVVAAFPGALIGVLLSSAVWRLTRPDIVTRWLTAGLGAATLAGLHSSVVIGWPWRALLQTWIPGLATGLSPHAVALSVPAEALAGPAALVLFQAANALWGRTIHGQEWARYQDVVSRKKALERHWPGPAGSDQGPASEGSLRLGVGTQDRRPFEIGAGELAQHIFLPGASGYGKTTTLVTLADGALANGYGVVIVDFKGSELGGLAKKLASRHHLPFTVVDPKDPASLGYNPCAGDVGAVANKIVGAFSFTGEAEIYKQVAMGVVPVICRALKASGSEVNLDEIHDALNEGAMSRLGRRPGAEAFRTRLEDKEQPGKVGIAGYAGLQHRLDALMEGTFADVFRKRPALDWPTQLEAPQVTYLALSVTHAGEDVELFGRVIIQDLKQMCDERMRAIHKGKDVKPVLVIIDEFAGLREPTQIVDLLLQARQARTPLAVATQFLPEEASIRRPVMSAGILVVHRMEAEDAEQIAAQFGTHTSPILTAQVDYEAGTSEKGSVRWGEEYNIHPNDIKELPIGVAAVYARQSQRRAIVNIDQTL